MRRLGFWVVVVLITWVIGARGASAELSLPSLVINGKTYSNVVVTPSSAERVMVRHGAGIGTFKIADFDQDGRQQLVEAGIITGVAAKEVLARKSSRSKTFGQSTNANGFAIEPEGAAIITDNAVVQSMRTRLQNEARAFGIRPADVEQAVSTLSFGVGVGILAVIVFFYILRCWCLFRICERATGRGSILVYAPLLRWFPLADAAKMSRHWLVIPLFGLAGLYVPPALPRLPWIPLAYLAVISILWLATAILFLVWCIRICKSLQRTPLLAVLLALPLLDWFALLFLAFSQSRSEEKISLGGQRLAI